jgi:glycosyltransferase involved in cell wall biosynthesis
MARLEVSVLMSVHNGERYLSESVESILNQTFADYEFLIIDDGSTDETWNILADYGKQDRRIVLVRNEHNIGLTKSLNKGLNLARGKYVARQDADDVSLPNRVEVEHEFLEEHDAAQLVGSNLEIIDHNGRRQGALNRACSPDRVAWWMLFYNYVGGHSSVLFRRAAALDVGGYDPSIRYAQDYDLWLRLLRLGDLAILPDVLLRWRLHDGNVSVLVKEKQWRSAIKSAQRAIGALLGAEPSSAEMSALVRFWRPGDFRMEGNIYAIHKWLHRAGIAFVQHRCQRGADRWALGKWIQKSVEEQFWLWYRQTPWHRSPLSKLQWAAGALAWGIGSLCDRNNQNVCL